MKNFKFFPVFVLCVFSFFVLASCGWRSVNKDAEMESVFPEDSFFVFVLDTSNENQMANLHRLAGMFPEPDEDLSMILSMMNPLMALGDNFEQEDLEAFLEEPFRLGFAARGGEFTGMEVDRTKNTAYAATSMDRPPLDFFDDDYDGAPMEIYGEDFWMDDADFQMTPPDTSGLMDYPFGTPVPGASFDLEEEFYFAIESKAAHVLEKLLTDLTEETPGVFSFEETRGVKYWRQDREGGAIVRYGDIFFASNKDDAVEEAVARLNKGDTFFVPDKEIESLAYFYVGDFSGMEFGGFGLSPDFLGAAWNYLIVEADGVRVLGKQEFVGDEGDLEASGIGVEHDFGLAKKVGGEGVFFYNENFNLLFIVDMILEALPFDVGFDVPAALVGLKADSFRGLLDSPFAFVISHTGRVVPNMAFYLDVGEDKADDAKTVVSVLSAYLDEVTTEFEDVMTLYGQEESEDILQKDVVPMKGSTLHRVTFNLSDYDDDVVSSIGDLEVYYGVTPDNVLVLTLHENFTDFYGKDVVFDGEIFEKIYGNVSSVGNSVTYFDFDVFSEVLYGVAGLGGAGEEYNSMVRPFLAPLKFFVKADYYEDGFLWSDAFVAIGAVEEEAKTIEAKEDKDARILR